MRLMIAALAALWMITPASASFTTDDRYFDSRASVATPQKTKARKAAYRKIQYVRKVVSRRKIQPHDRITLTTADEQRSSHRETIQDTLQFNPAPVALGPRPRDSRGNLLPWCGWFLGKILGLHDRKLWLARNWAHVGAPAEKRPGVIVVWRHHVGKITAVRANGDIKVLSGNDGRAVRDRWRSARGVIAYRAL